MFKTRKQLKQSPQDFIMMVTKRQLFLQQIDDVFECFETMVELLNSRSNADSDGVILAFNHVVTQSVNAFGLSCKIKTKIENDKDCLKMGNVILDRKFNQLNDQSKNIVQNYYLCLKYALKGEGFEKYKLSKAYKQSLGEANESTMSFAASQMLGGQCRTQKKVEELNNMDKITELNKQHNEILKSATKIDKRLRQPNHASLYEAISHFGIDVTNVEFENIVDTQQLAVDKALGFKSKDENNSGDEKEDNFECINAILAPANGANQIRLGSQYKEVVIDVPFPCLVVGENETNLYRIKLANPHKEIILVRKKDIITAKVDAEFVGACEKALCELYKNGLGYQSLVALKAMNNNINMDIESEDDNDNINNFRNAITVKDIRSSKMNFTIPAHTPCLVLKEINNVKSKVQFPISNDETGKYFELVLANDYINRNDIKLIIKYEKRFCKKGGGVLHYPTLSQQMQNNNN